MTNRLLFFACLSLLLSFAACDESEEQEVNSACPKIKTITNYQGDLLKGSIAFKYDPSGRLIKKSYSEGNYYTYAYASGSIIQQIYNSDGTIANTDTLFLNDKGLVISGNYFTYEYNTEGYQVKRTLNITEHQFKIENGNMIQESVMNIGNEESFRIISKHEFLPNSINTIGNENMGIAFYGKQNKELASGDYGTTPFSVSWTYQYEFDSKKRVSKRKIQNGISNIYTYYD